MTDWGLVLQIVAATLTLLGIFIGGFWRMWGLIKSVRDEANTKIDEVRDEANLRAEASLAVSRSAKDELAAHKLHTAESYITKAGMRETTEQIMDAIGSLGAQITSMNGRIDRMLERPTARTSAPRT